MMTQMRLKRLRSMDKEHEQVSSSSNNIFSPDKELQVSENYLQLTEACESESLNISGSVSTTMCNEQEKATPVEDILMVNDHITNEDQIQREEFPDADSQSKINQLIQELEEYKLSNQHLQSQLQETKALQTRPTITKEKLQENEYMLTYYTALLNYETLTLVFELAQKVMPNSKEHGNRKLTNFEEFLLVLIKLRLNLQNKDLGYRFKVSKSSVSQIIHKWLNILYHALRFLIRWPSREELRATLPESFQENSATQL